MNVGIVCEYNPFHLGHQKQIDSIREKFGANTGIICAMSAIMSREGIPPCLIKPSGRRPPFGAAPIWWWSCR